MTSRGLLSCFAVLAMYFAACAPSQFARAQISTQSAGIVTDSCGALIPNAQVQITNMSDLRVSSIETDERGGYNTADLIPGQYDAAVTAPGFETSGIARSVLNGSDVSQGNAVLHPATQTVDVCLHVGPTPTRYAMSYLPKFFPT